MIKSKRFLIIGIIVICIPLSGFPVFWKTTFLVISGFSLIALSLNISIPKKVAKRNLRRKEKNTPVFSESIPVYKESIIKEKESQDESLS